MTKKLKEKKDQNNSKFDLDNEIIIGIKTLPEPPKSKKKSNNKRTNNKIHKKVKTSKKRKDDETELKLGIEDEKIKNRKTKKQTKKKAKINPKKKYTLRIIKWITILLILIGGTIYFLLSPIFNIKNIEVKGNNKLTKEEIISLSQIQLEENTFKLVKNKVEKSVKQNSYIENVKVHRKLPDTVIIEVEERIPTYMIAFANAYAYINNQGYFLEISKDKIEVPLITGYSTKEEEIQEGSRLCLEDLQKLESVLQIVKAAESNELSSLITKINISNKQDYILELKSEKKSVHIGNTTNLSTKMLYIKSIIEQNKNIEGEILVNTDLSNKGAIFRKKV